MKLVPQVRLSASIFEKILDKKIKIDGSNRREIAHFIRPNFQNSLVTAQLAVFETLVEKRIQRAMEYLDLNNHDIQDAVQKLCPEFSPPGQAVNETMTETVVNEARCRIGRSRD